MWFSIKLKRNVLLKILFIIYICPINCQQTDPLIFSTNECYLTEPIYGYKFDFGTLRSDLAHQAIGINGDIFDYNICGNLTRTCDGKSDVAACLKRGDKEFVLGTQHQLNYRNGKMFFSFANGAKCPNGKGQFELHVSIGCDYTLDKIQSQVTSYADEACSFYLTLESPQACLPEPNEVKSNLCSVTDTATGHTFNLMSLSDTNYRTTDRSGSAFVINVCKPVLYGENAMCPANSSVCFVSLKSEDYKKKFFNYGTVQANPTIENGKLLMRHVSTTVCNGTDNYSSIIYFYCDQNVKNAHPEFIGLHGCVYEFSFVTPLACNNLAPCTTISHGNEILDMSKLKDKPFTLQMQDKKYTFAVCSAAGNPCLEKDGACLTSDRQSISLGIINSHLRFNQTGSPYLLYENGAVCKESNATATTFWSTKIEFVCANNATIDKGNTGSGHSAGGVGATTVVQGPKIIENSNCQLLIHYQTDLACQEQITCKAKAYVEHSEDGTGEELVDLTPLISATENYEAKIDSSLETEELVGKTTKFYLNVCRPLVPRYGLGCPGGSAGCMAEVGTSPTPEKEKSLGFPLASLVAINRTTAELRYLKGDTCPTDKNSQLSMAIRFNCDIRAGRGTPVLQSISDCHYQFYWATNVICKPHMCRYKAETCEIFNDELNASYNFKKAPFTQDGKIKIKNTEYVLNVCGTHQKPVTDYSQGLVNLFFSTNGPCKNGPVNVQFRLICSNETSIAYSNDDNTQCNVVYAQHTPDICSFLGLAVPDKPETTTSTPSDENSNADSANNGEHPAEQTGSIGAILAAILSLTFFVACFGVLAFSPERRDSVKRLFRRTTSAVMYTRVQSNEEANLLLEQNDAFSDSDEDMLL